MLDINIENSWKEELLDEIKKTYFQKLITRLKLEYTIDTIYPPKKLLFQAFKRSPFYSTKVVIIGQDPYHGFNQANGLCFSVNKNTNIPPSLVNIFKEVKSNFDDLKLKDGDLSPWADQGVFLLNSILTVKAHNPGSHSGYGWEMFTNSAIIHLSKKRKNLVFMLWGNYAQQKIRFIERNDHLILTAPHPSPLSAYRGFLGSKHFLKTNQYLIKKNIQPIIW